MEPPNRACPGCGYDARLYTWDDLVNTVRTLPKRWRWMLDGIDSALVRLRARGSGEARSALDLLADTGSVVAAAYGELGNAEGAVPPAPVDLDQDALVLLEESCRLLVRHARDLDDSDAVSARAVLERVGHEMSHAFSGAGRILHGVGAGAEGDAGRVSGLFVSDGGVPKHAVASATVTAAGMADDAQSDRRNHGRPWQALCIWSDEILVDLVGEGHPLRPGGLGENVLVTGLDWKQIRPGVRMLLGPPATGVLVEVSAYSEPCNTIAASFSGGDYSVVHPDRHPGRARAYASVLRTGQVCGGDDVHVEPGPV